MSAIAVPAGYVDLEPLSDVLQAAFFDDPVTSWLFPDEGSRSRRLARMFRALMTGHYMPMRTVWTTHDQAAAALWAPPGHATIPIPEMLRSGPGLLLSLGRRTVRSIRFLNEVERNHPHEPHWYLGVLGTTPPHQGKGLGTALLQPVLDRCDREGVPAYLESSKESNIPFYARHGFELRGEVSVKGGPTVWPMWRDPQPAPA